MSLSPSAFDWADAGIGAGTALALVLLLSGVYAASRRRRRAAPVAAVWG